jgi:RimJ/RimL family protein N-acetyltransferase
MNPENQLPEMLETERLIIRVAQPGDGVLFNDAVVESWESLRPWLGWVSPPPSLEESELACRKAYARFLLNEDLMVFFLLKSDGTLVGGGGLHDADWTLRRFEVGYWGRARFGGQGLMTEGVRGLTEFALSELSANRVFLTTDDQNIPSWKLAERAGFEYEGTLRNERFNLQGALRDTRVYSRIASHEPSA